MIEQKIGRDEFAEEKLARVYEAYNRFFSLLTPFYKGQKVSKRDAIVCKNTFKDVTNDLKTLMLSSEKFKNAPSTSASDFQSL